MNWGNSSNSPAMKLLYKLKYVEFVLDKVCL